MIDLSHLTEEEQGMIMTVLKRDAELKKAEEERIGKLQKLLSSSSRSELKHLTGEWFYEAKSRRHMDKIHGSEIILASMKQRKSSGLDGSLRLERYGASSGRGSDIVAPPKPGRLLETTQPQEMSDAEKEKLNSALCSQGRPRHNPFNRDSLILVEPPEKTEELLTNGDGESSETEPLKNHTAGQATQTSGGSITSDRSSVGFRPVPKKRTFLSRRPSTPSVNNGSGLGPHAGSKVIVPAPRVSLQHGSSGTSNQSSLRGIEEISQKTTVTTSNEVSLSGQPPSSPNEVCQQPLCDASKVSPDIGLERTKERAAAYTEHDGSSDRVIPESGERDDLTYREYAGVHTVSLSTTSIQDSETEKDRNVGSAMTQEELSLAQSIVDQPIRYDLNFIDKPNQHSPKKSLQKLSILSPQTPSPTGDEEDSIAKVLEWFSRSTDSNDWLNIKDSQQANSFDKQGDIRIKESLTKDAENIYENRIRDKKSEAPEIKRDHLQRETNEAKDNMDEIKLRATDRLENKEVTEREEVRKDTRAQIRVHKVKENEDESQPHKISHLKSFWEKGNTGPKILISRSNTTSGLADQTQSGEKSVQLSMEKEKEKEVNDSKPHISEMPFVPGLNSVKGEYVKYASNPKDEREQEQPLSVSPQKDIGGSEIVQLNRTSNQQADYTPKKGTSHAQAPEMHTSTTYLGKQQSPGSQRKEDQKYNADYLILPADPQVVDRRGSDTEIISLTRLSPQPRTLFQSRLSPESERFSPLRLSPQPDSLHQSRDKSFIPTPQQEEMSRASTTSEFDTNLQSRDSSDSEKLYQSRNIPYMDSQRGGTDIQLTPKTQMQRGSSDDVKSRDGEDRSVQSSMTPKKKEDCTNKDRSNSPRSQKQGLKHQESTAERIKQFKTFWEQEKNKPMFYTGKSKALGDGKATRGANLGKLNKRFTKSEYDLSSLGNDSGSDIEDSDRNHKNFTILAMNQRQDKLSPSLGANRAQFNNLCEFWGEATSNRRGSVSIDKPKIAKKKEQIEPTTVHVDKSSARPFVIKSSPPSQNRSKSPHDRQMSGSGAGNDNKPNLSHYVTVELGQQRDPRRASRDSTREDKPTKPQSNLGKETRSPKTKKNSFGNSSGRGSAMHRATSMFTLNVSEEQDEPFLSQFKKTQEASPVHSQSRRQSADRTQNRRQSADKGATSRRPAEDSETLTPRARAFVPRDYRHYLGMTEKTVHTSLAPTLNEQGSEGEPGYDLDRSGPVSASTPVGSEERYGSKTSQRPLRVNYSSSDTGQESSLSSTSETWSNSRNSSNRENDDEDQNPVKRALRRAEARPKNLAKSLEDITASLAPRQERRQDPIADLRRSSDVRSIPSPSSSLHSDPEHLKKMSKSVPSFLQKEGYAGDTDSTSEDSYHRGRQKMGPSMTNLTNSSGMASMFSLSGSVMTMYSGDLGNLEVQGNIQFSINYVQKLREFHIFVAQCQDLAAVDPKRGRSDPYVKSYLVPDKANLGKRKTSVKKKTLNPTFKEILRYRVRLEYLRTQMLILSVWHHDTFGRNSFLGEIDVDLSKWDFDHTQMNYLALKARTTPTGVPNDRGEIKLAIRFLPQITHSEGVAKEGPNAGEVHIWVKECKNLPLIRASIDPYVKCFVLPDTSRKSRQKTRVLQRTVDPIFNHTMVYDGIKEEDLTEVCAELTVWDRDRLASNLLGGLRLGPGTGRSYGAVVDWMDSTPYEVAMWERMMAAPNEWVEDVLPLRMLTSAKTVLK